MRLILNRCSREVDLTVVATHRNGSPLGRAVASVTGVTAVLARLALHRPNVVHLHVAKRGSLVRKGLLTWAASALRVPVVLHCHGGMFERDFRRMPAALQRVVSATFRRAAVVIVLSESWLSVYGDLVGVPAEKLTVAMNCVEVPAVLPQRAAEPLGVAFLGRLGPQKGAWDLVRAVAQLPAPLRTLLRVRLAGDGDVAGTRALVAQQGLDDVIEVRDWLEATERDQVLAESAVLALPSPNEGLPMSLLEAMAWGLVPVVSPVGGIPEVVTDGVNGLLVQPGDPADIGAALRRLVEDPALRAELSAAARRSAEAGFSIEAYSEKLERVWAAVVPARGRPA
jgi:glycosyltransferase involved in cell wall biosynthesis